MTGPGILMVVSGSPETSALLSNILTVLEIPVRTAVSGEQVLALMTTTPVELVLLDTVLAGVDGFEVCRRIKASPTQASVPVILFRQGSGPQDLVKGLQAGAADCLSQPFSRDELLARVTSHLEQGRRLASLERTVADLRGANKRLQSGLIELQRVAAEKDRKQVQQVQDWKLEAVGRFAGGVAHDFNNMLGVILGHAELLLERFPAEDPAGADLREIQRAAVRSTELTRQLLTYARRQPPNPQVVDLDEMISGILRTVPRVVREDVELDWTSNPELWRVRLGAGQAEQILMDLLGHANPVLAPGGKLSMEAVNLAVDEEVGRRHGGIPPGRYVLLTVRDDGAGLGKEALDRIFEPFPAMQGHGPGTGLGLALVHSIIIQNHGQIRVASEPGRGTTFRIYLPTAETVATPVPMRPHTLTVRGSETVLLVEDEVAVLRLAKTILERSGYRVLAVASPITALEKAREFEGPIHLLMTDVVMPQLDGRELHRRIRSMFPSIKTLFMSGYTPEFFSDSCPLEDSHFFLQKPFSVKSLTEKIRETLEA